MLVIAAIHPLCSYSFCPEIQGRRSSHFMFWPAPQKVDQPCGQIRLALNQVYTVSLKQKTLKKSLNNKLKPDSPEFQNEHHCSTNLRSLVIIVDPDQPLLTNSLIWICTDAFKKRLMNSRHWNHIARMNNTIRAGLESVMLYFCALSEL